MIKHLFLTFGTQVVILFMNIIGGIITARLLGPGGKGELTAVVLWPSVLASAGGLGLVEGLVYTSGCKRAADIPSFVSSIFLAVFIHSLPLIWVGMWLLPLLMSRYDHSVISITRLALGFIPLNLFTLYLASIFQGRMFMGIYNMIRFLVVGSNLLGVFLLGLFKLASVQGFVIVLLGANLVIFLYELFWVVKMGWLKISFSPSIHRELYSYGIRVFPGNLSALLYSKLDQLIIASALTPASLGLYAVSVSLSGTINMVSGTIATVAFPAISKQNVEDLQGREIVRFTRLGLWASGALAIVLLFSSQWLVPILYGRAYSDAIPIVRILVLASLFTGCSQVLSCGWKGIGKPSVSTFGEILALAVAVLSLVILLPKWGLAGASLSALLVGIVNFLYLLFSFTFRMRLNPSFFFIPQKDDLTINMD